MLKEDSENYHDQQSSVQIYYSDSKENSGNLFAINENSNQHFQMSQPEGFTRTKLIEVEKPETPKIELYFDECLLVKKEEVSEKTK